MPIGIGAAILGSAVIGGGASLIAANDQTKAAKQALGVQQQQFAQGQANLAPFLQESNYAGNAINQLYGFPSIGGGAAGGTAGGTSNALGSTGSGTPDYSGFFNSPDYQFALQQGTLAVDRSAASKGLLMSGGTLKDLTSFGQGLASQQYGNYFNRLMGLYNTGAGAAGQSAQLSSNAAGTLGSTITGIGAAQASGPVGVANALSTLPQNLLYSNALGSSSPSGYASFTNSAIGADPAAAGAGVLAGL